MVTVAPVFLAVSIILIPAAVGQLITWSSDWLQLGNQSRGWFTGNEHWKKFGEALKILPAMAETEEGG